MGPKKNKRHKHMNQLKCKFSSLIMCVWDKATLHNTHLQKIFPYPQKNFNLICYKSNVQRVSIGERSSDEVMTQDFGIIIINLVNKYLDTCLHIYPK